MTVRSLDPTQSEDIATIASLSDGSNNNEDNEGIIDEGKEHESDNDEKKEHESENNDVPPFSLLAQANGLQNELQKFILFKTMIKLFDNHDHYGNAGCLTVNQLKERERKIDSFGDANSNVDLCSIIYYGRPITQIPYRTRLHFRQEIDLEFENWLQSKDGDAVCDLIISEQESGENEWCPSDYLFLSNQIARNLNGTSIVIQDNDL